MTIDPRYDKPHWHRAHELYLDAVAQQSEKMRTVLAREVGDTFEGFIKACEDGLIVISSHFLDDEAPAENVGLNYVIAVRVSDGMATLAVIHAARLGLDTVENAADEFTWNLRKK